MKITEVIVEQQELDEIERLRPSDYRGGKSYLNPGRDTKTFTPLPGGSGLTYSIEDPRYEPIIKLWDPNTKTADPKPKQEYNEFTSEYNERLAAWQKRQATGEKIPQIIGKLTLEVPYDGFPLKGALQVGTITVDEDYRGMGLAKALYGIVLSVMKRPLIAGSSQTPGGRKNWVSLSQIPGVEMKGYFRISDAAFNTIQPSRYDDDWDKKYMAKTNAIVDQNIDEVMGKLGGQYIGRVRGGDHYFAFDVRPTTNGAELEAYIKNNLAKVYGNTSFGEAGLFAVWTGQA